MAKQYELTLERKTPEARQVRDAFARAMNHPDFEALRESKLYIDLVLVCDAADNPDKPTGPVLKHQGLYAAAICERVNAKARLFGAPDVVIWVDRYSWMALSLDEERDALIDHELRHIGVRAGAVDDAGRPAVQIREHDHHVGFFVGTSLRYGQSSPEARYMRAMLRSPRCTQGYLSGLAPEEAAETARAAQRAVNVTKATETTATRSTSQVMADSLAKAKGRSNGLQADLDAILTKMVEPFGSMTMSVGASVDGPFEPPSVRLTVEQGKLVRTPVTVPASPPPTLDDEDGMPMGPDMEPRQPF